MPFAHAGMAGITFRPHQFGPQITVANIFRISMTIDIGSITTENTDIVQHSCLFYKGKVKIHLRMHPGYSQSFICHTSTMNNQNPVRLRTYRIIFGNNI